MKRPDAAFTEQIDAKLVGRLLCCEGWLELREFWDDIIIYRRPTEEKTYAEILLPKKRDEKYGELMATAALNYAEYVGRPVNDVLFYWKNPNMDRVRYRLISEQTQFGATSLRRAQDFLSGIAATLRVAVKDTEAPAPYHKTSRSSTTNELMETAEFGQTEHGSFVANIFVPLGELKEADKFGEAKRNVYRASLEGFMKTLSAAIDSVEAGTAEQFLQREENRNVSGNFFEAITRTQGEEAELEISVDWSPLFPVSQDVPVRAYVKKEYIKQFDRWAQARRPKGRDALQQEFIANVCGLLGTDRDEANRLYGEVVLSVLNIEEDRHVDAKVSLTASDYEVAIKNYLQGSCVIFNGNCVWNGGRLTTFEKISNFRGVESNK